MNSLDWKSLMRAGFNGLGLKPAEFWALTPVELSIMLGIETKNMPLGRTRLEEMIRDFPDQERTRNG